MWREYQIVFDSEKKITIELWQDRSYDVAAKSNILAS